MDYRHQATDLIRSLLDDQGEQLRVNLELGEWDAVWSTLPAVLFRFHSERPAITLLGLARDYWSKAGQIRPAVATTRALLDYHEGSSGPVHPDTWVERGALGLLAIRTGRVERGEFLLLQALEGLREHAGPRDLRTGVVAGNLALIRVKQGRTAEAEPLLTLAYQIRKSAAPKTVGLLSAQLGELRVRLGKLDAALPLLRESWMMHLDELGELHHRTIDRARFLANVLNRCGKHREAAPVLRDIYAYLQTHGDEAAQAAAAYDLGVALTGAHRKPEGLRLIEQSLQWARSQPGTHPALPPRLTKLAELYIARGHVQEAEGLLQEAAETQRLLTGEDSPELASRYATIGHFCAQTGRLDDAIGWIEPAAELLLSSWGGDHPRTKEVVGYQVVLFTRLAERSLVTGDNGEAAAWLRRGRMAGLQALRADHPSILAVQALAAENQLVL